MKKNILLFIALIVAAFSHAQNTFPASGSTGIGTATPASSAILEVKSTTQGVLVARMTKTQRDAIPSPATGLLIYQTNSTPGFYYYTGSAWAAVSPKGLNKNLSNLSSPTAVNEVIQPNGDNTIDLGSSSFSWKDLYVDGIGTLGTAKVGNYVGTPQAGMIRWTGTDFEGYNGTSWISLTATGPSYSEGTGISIAGNTITNAAPTQWTTDGSNISYSSGNVGIGSASPSFRLSLQGTPNEIYSVWSENGTQSADNFSWQIAPGTGTPTTRIGYLFGDFGNSTLGFTIANSRSAPIRFGIGPSQTEMMRIDPSGNVGIGVTSPSNKLEVNGTTRTTNFQMTSGASDGLVLQSDGTGNASWVNPGSLPITESDPEISASSTSSVPRWDGSTLTDGTIYDDGNNVGIGTSSPTQKLEVSGTTKTTSFQMTNGAISGYVLQSDENGNAIWVNAATLNVAGDDLGNHTAIENIQLGNHYISSDGDDEGIFVSSDGKVNIGGNDPALPLQITSNNTPGIRLDQTSGTYPGYTWDVAANETNFMIRDINNSSALPFRLFAGNSSNQLVINSNKVGIGTISPSEKLEVNGTTKTTNLQMTSGATNGYVLKSDSNGNASWVNANTLTVSESDPQVSSSTSNKVPRWNGTTLLDGTITDNGSNVGIGTSSPATKLTVSSGNTFAVEINGTSTSGTWVGLNNSASGGSNWSILSGASSMLPGDLAFRDGTGNIRMAIQSSDGSVGIGTSSPTAILHTVGSGSKTSSYSANLLTNAASSIISGITKAALELTSTGSWTGVTSRNIGLYVSTVTGGTNNYDAIFNGGGNVGIGTTSPSQKLEVSGTTKTTNLQVTSGANNGYVLQSDASGNASWVNPTSLANGNWTTSGINQYSALSGNVGIGSTSPTSKLEVTASGLQTLNYYGTVLSNTATSTNNNVIKVGLNITSLGAWTGTSAKNIGLYVSSVSGGTNNYDAIFDGGGNVGIGTISPSQKLEVSGTTKTTNFQMTNGATNGYVFQSDAGGNASWVNANTLSVSETDPQVSSGTSDKVPRWNGTTLTDGIITDNGTNIGIGTSSPSQKLDVSGTTKTTNFQMTNGATSGNVLQSDASGNASWVNPNTLSLGQWTTSGNNISNSNSGNVGIGTSSPDSKLNVSASKSGINTFVSHISNTANGGSAFNNGLQIDAGSNSGTFNASFLSEFIGFKTPNATLIGAVIQGTASSVSYQTTSDQRLKENIRDTRYGLNDLMRIQVSDYNYKTDPSMQQTGFIAQQLYTVFPDAVRPGGDDAKSDPWMVDYGRITPLLVKSIQELDEENGKLKEENSDLNEKVDEQQQQINALSTGLDEMMNKMSSMESSLSQCCTVFENTNHDAHNTNLDLPQLEQNVPNPFMQTSYIKFYIPSSSKDAGLVISNVNGTTVKQFKHLTTGFGTIYIEAGSLAAGTYQYSLMIDGKVIDSKQMVLTK